MLYVFYKTIIGNLANKRKNFSKSERQLLHGQTGGTCPLCPNRLMYQKKKGWYSEFDLAHIYPLNPTSDQLEELKGVVKLSEDPNDLDNIIPLCKRCHTIFDTPRTRDGYEKLYAIKKRLIARANASDFDTVGIKLDVLSPVIEGIASMDQIGDPVVNLNASEVTAKMQDFFPKIVIHQVIQHNQYHYYRIKDILLAMEEEKIGVSEIIYHNVRGVYLSFRSKCDNPEEVYESIVTYFCSTLKMEALAVEIVVSFFIQNCEIFDVSAK